MWKNFFNLTNLILIIIIVILLLIFISLLLRERKIEAGAVTLVQIAEIRSSLSAYFSERGEYPVADKVVLGGANTRVFCLADSSDTGQIFINDTSQCVGMVLLDFNQIKLISPIIYNSTGSGYRLDFNLPSQFGTFSVKGPYCATEQGIVPGKCPPP